MKLFRGSWVFVPNKRQLTFRHLVRVVEGGQWFDPERPEAGE